MNLTHVVTTAMKSFRQNVPDYLGAGVVDISTGMLLAVDTVDNHPREILDILAAATADLFQGRTVLQIEELWKKNRGVTDNRRYFNEILVNSENLVHGHLLPERQRGDALRPGPRRHARAGGQLTRPPAVPPR
jgi:CelD/BcsL family acetyltransferase involved in cellulose biosynthesis